MPHRPEAAWATWVGLVVQDALEVSGANGADGAVTIGGEGGGNDMVSPLLPDKHF